ncbi:MAG: tetratricopeptide repeat protein [Ferruginibacter sp.]
MPNFWKGEIAYRQQRYDDAIRHLDVFLKSGVPAQGEANYSAARYNTGYAWFQKEQYKNALPQFEAIAKSISSSSSALEQDAYARAADCYYMQRDFAKAGTMYDAIINNALPQADYALYQKGMIAGVKSSSR